jgi:hypothetical protein
MSEERDPFPTDDPRETGVSDQNAEENPDEVTPGEDPSDEDDDADE